LASPSKISHSLAIIHKWEYTPLCFLILMVLIFHFATIMQPSIQSMDEPYYVPAANSILHGESLGRIEHPPLGQSIIASGIWSFGNNPLGWRFFSVIFGTISLILFYLICREVKLPRYATLLATTLLGVDTLSFVQAGVAMLDVFCLTFMFTSVWFYLKKKYIWTGVFIGLATLAKLPGVFALLFILLHWVITNRKNIKWMVIIAATSAVTFLSGLTLLDFAILHKLQNPISRISSMLSFTKSLTYTLYNASKMAKSSTIPDKPWIWLYHLNGMEFISFDSVKHVWSAYDMIINPTIWILTIPSILFLLYLTLKRDKAAIFAVCWFAATCIIWIPISLITNRLTYDYYFYPAVGAICIGIALLLSRIKDFHVNNTFLRSILRLLPPLYLGVSILFFVFLYLGNVWLKASWAIILFFSTLYWLDRSTFAETVNR